MKIRRDRRSTAGFTLVEMLMAVAVLGFVSLMIASTFGDIFNLQNQVIARDEGNEFSSSVARFLFTDNTCSSTLRGQKFTPSGKNDLNLPGYLGYGASTDPAGSPTVLSKGMNIDNKLRISELSIEDSGMPPQSVISGGVSLQRYLARVKLGMETANQGKWRASPVRNFEFPVLVLNGQIERCYIAMMVDDACQVLGSSLDPTTGKCVPMTQCMFEGHFTLSRCSPNIGGCPGSFINELTGGTSCPSGVATQRETGQYNWSYTVNCGKKCTQTVSVNTRYYVCLKCSN
jgi:prepilin-type N-terminal cleavage/methylation domain-containing protein